MELKEYMAEKREYVWQLIDEYLKKTYENDIKVLELMYKDKKDRYMDELNYHWTLVRDYPERKGKYIRPTLILMMAEALGADLEKARTTAAAMQMSEDWILVHDDFEDDSEERRGKPALHRIVGPELAVNAGDSLHIIMHKALHDNYDILGTELAKKVNTEFFQMLDRTVFGQTVEIKWTKDNKQNMENEDVFFTVGGKTVYYSIAGPLRMGAIIAGATDEQVDQILEFGYPLGICFQIRDDILDLTSDFEGLKQQKYNDIFEGKRTVMLAHVMREATPEELEKINACLNKPRPEKTMEEVQFIRDLMDKYKSIEYAQDMAANLAKEAEQKLEELTFIPENEAKQKLREIVHFILNRKH